MEYSVVNLSKILSDNSLLRFDAEYYHPQYLEAESRVKNKTHKELRDIIPEFCIKIVFSTSWSIFHARNFLHG